ncbi:MAG: c-type cytochrome [Rhodospirillales bacterium]
MATKQQADPLFWNKVAGAILFSGLIAMTAGFMAELLVHPKMLKENVLAVAVPESATKGPVEQKPLEPIGPLLAKADITAGQKAANKCLACHSFDKGGANKVGPNLWDVVGGPHAHNPAFSYSPAMSALKDKPWDYEALNKYLHNPKAAVPGNKMAFAGISSDKERADIIAYLRSRSDAPKPLP